jgi:hypothetical protein
MVKNKERLGRSQWLPGKAEETDGMPMYQLHHQSFGHVLATCMPFLSINLQLINLSARTLLNLELHNLLDMV